jgi:serine/threonine protein kinase
LELFPEIPDYSIEKKLGQGRITDIYLAIDEDTKEKVVLKILKPKLAEEEKFAKRFLYEVSKAAKLDHPNIAEILDSGETGEFYYFVSEYYIESLRDRLIRQHLSSSLEFEVTDNSVGPMADESRGEEADAEGPELHEVLDTFRQLFDAVDYAHQEEAIHRDIRPENIFFKEDGTPVFVDFCMSPLIRASETLRKNGIKDSHPHYLSPEQALKKHVDSSSDIYSLGVTLFEVLTGKPPYDATEAIAIENQHVMEPIPRLPEHLKLFQPLIDSMMAKTSEERAANGAELILFMEEISDQLQEIRTTVSLTPPEESVPDETAEVSSPQELSFQEIPMQMETYHEEEPKEEQTFVKHDAAETREAITISSVDDILKISKPGALGRREAYIDENAPLGPDMNFPSVPPGERPSFRLKTTNSDGIIEEILQKLREPKLLIPVIAAVVIIVVLIIFVLPSGKAGTPGPGEETEAAQKQAPVLTPEEQKELDSIYNRKFQLARKEFKAGQYEKAIQQLEAAAKIKVTEEVKKLKQDIEAQQALEKDDADFTKASGADDIASYREYVDKYPSGRHTAEARKKLNVLEEAERKHLAQIKKWSASAVTLRSTPRSLQKEDVRAILKSRNFFEKYYNKTGNFENHYELQTINGQTVIMDYSTGLMWMRAGSGDYMDYEKALKWVESLNGEKFAGFSDWRIPTLEEAASLMENKENRFNLFIDKIFAKEQRYIWTGDTFGNDKAWALDFYAGDVNPVGMTFDAFIRPVRANKQNAR